MRSLIDFYKACIGAGRERFAFLIMFMMAGALFESVGFTMFVPLLSVVFGVRAGSGDEPDKIAEIVQSVFGAVGMPVTPATILITISSIIIIKSVFQFIQRTAGYRFALDFEFCIKQRLFNAVNQSDWVYFAKQKSSNLLNATVVETRSAGSAYLQLVLLTAEIITATIFLSFSIAISWKMFVGLAFFFLPVTFFVRILFRLSREYGKQMVNANVEVMKHTGESFRNSKYLRSQNLVERVTRLFEEESKKLVNYNFRFGRITSLFESIGDPISVVTICTLIYVTYIYNLMPMAHFIVLVLLLQRAFARVMNVQRIYQKIVKLIPSYEKCIEVTQGAINNQERKGGGLPVPHIEKLELHNLCFSYDKTVEVLKNISMTIPAGKMVALVGKSGGGKTTIADTLTGLLEPSSGKCMLNGRSLSEYSIDEWRKKIGYIPQESVLFDGTVAENISMGRDDIAMEQVITSAKSACADEFITKMEKGYQTRIGDRGAQLSGGERQRIALARALARKPEFLILDEATSALDNESEQKIGETINRLRKSITIVVIAHRLSTVRNADMLYVIEDGEVIESGIPEKLIAEKEGRFAELYRLS